MKPNPSGTRELLKKVAKSASWWRRFLKAQMSARFTKSFRDYHHWIWRHLTSGCADGYYNLNNWQSLRPSDVSFAEPTHSDFERIQSALVQVEAKLPQSTAKGIHDCLKIYFK